MQYNLKQRIGTFFLMTLNSEQSKTVRKFDLPFILSLKGDFELVTSVFSPFWSFVDTVKSVEDSQCCSVLCWQTRANRIVGFSKARHRISHLVTRQGSAHTLTLSCYPVNITNVNTSCKSSLFQACWNDPFLKPNYILKLWNVIFVVLFTTRQ